MDIEKINKYYRRYIRDSNDVFELNGGDQLKESLYLFREALSADWDEILQSLPLDHGIKIDKFGEWVLKDFSAADKKPIRHVEVCVAWTRIYIALTEGL